MVDQQARVSVTVHLVAVRCRVMKPLDGPWRHLGAVIIDLDAGWW